MKIWFLLIMTSLATASVQAQTLKPWVKEPSAIFGIAIGQPLDTDRIDKCGGKRADPLKERVPACIMSDSSSGNLTLSDFPGDLFDTGFIQTNDGVVASLLLKAPHSKFIEVRQLLIERYGKPTTFEMQTLQNGYGKKFSSEVMVWAGKSITLTVSERMSDTNVSGVYFGSNAQSAANSSGRKKSIQDALNKM